MMRKKCFIGIMVAFFVCFIATSCTKRNFGDTAQEDDFGLNFKAVVMGDKSINPLQDWSTVASIPVEVSIDYGSNQSRTVYIYQTPPLIDNNAAYIGMARLSPGETKTICVIKPTQVGLLYAACYDDAGHAVCKPFIAEASGSKIHFGNAASYTRSATTGNNWSVPTQRMPSTSKYTSGNLIEVSDFNPEYGETTEAHLKISSDFKGFLPYLTTRNNLSVYVTGTWTLTFDQQFVNGNVLVVGDGGKVVIPEGFKLSTESVSGGAPGIIYVLPGGEISGPGSLELSCKADNHYNSGTITTNEVTIKGGMLYNDGTIGQIENSKTSIMGETSNNGIQNTLINHGFIYLSQIGGSSLSVQNAAHIQASGNIVLNSSSKMDDGAYMECGSLTLEGNSNGNEVLYMGNQSYVNCNGNLDVNNYGVWGPSGSGYISNAIFKINRCSHCATTEGIPATYMLDHVELVLPEDYPTIFDKGILQVWGGEAQYYGMGYLSPTASGTPSVQLLYDWFNGYAGKVINPVNYHWLLDSNNKNNFLWTGATAPHDSSINESRQTCTYSLGPSYSVDGSNYSTYQATFQKSFEDEPDPNYIYYAFELADNTHDFSYNDVIIRLATPTDNNDGTFTSIAEAVAVGTSLYTKVQLKNEGAEAKDFGKELHIVLGTTTTANISKFDRFFNDLDTLTFTSPNFQLDKMNFSLYIVDKNNLDYRFSGADHIIENAPTYIVVSGDNAGKWFWPSNKMNIALAYPLFNTWGNNMIAAPDWYLSSNADASRVLKW